MISGGVSVGQLSRRECRLYFTRTSAQSDDRTICRRCAVARRSSGVCSPGRLSRRYAARAADSVPRPDQNGPARERRPLQQGQA